MLSECRHPRWSVQYISCNYEEQKLIPDPVIERMGKRCILSDTIPILTFQPTIPSVFLICTIWPELQQRHVQMHKSQRKGIMTSIYIIHSTDTDTRTINTVRVLCTPKPVSLISIKMTTISKRRRTTIPPILDIADRSLEGIVINLWIPGHTRMSSVRRPSRHFAGIDITCLFVLPLCLRMSMSLVVRIRCIPDPS